MGCSSRPGRVVLRSIRLLDGSVLQNALHVNAGRHHAIRIERAWFHQFLNFGDGAFCRRSHHRIEVARRLAVDEVAERGRPSRL